MRHKRPPAFERLVFGTAFVLAAIVLFYTGRRALKSWSGEAAPPLGAVAAEFVPPLPVGSAIERSGARDGVLNLPPLKVAGVGGGRRRKASEPPPPK